MRAEIGNIFRTNAEAEARADLLRWMTPALWRKIAVLREMMEFADEAGNYRIEVDKKGNIGVEIVAVFHYGEPHFASAERARECIAAIGEERLKRDYFGVAE